ncbi:2Fe-2S iron-sulfur cluster-binding protein [Flavobacterium sp. TMP13]|uniref:2Fe-2S iron-sulfur cluster-binding protein n=1 Tax=Flavobacterium sp. TMP13 TaxID=3425950 RepID=UPI003D778D41
MDKIILNIQSEGVEYRVTTYQNEYRSLMQLIRDNSFLEDFGDCGGVGRCCTCVVEIISKEIPLTPFDGNERATIQKHDLDAEKFRLACQIMIDKSIDGLVVKVFQE